MSDIYIAAIQRVLAEGEAAMRSFRQENETIDQSFREGTLYAHITDSADKGASTLDEQSRKYARRRTGRWSRAFEPGGDDERTARQKDPGSDPGDTNGGAAG